MTNAQNVPTTLEVLSDTTTDAALSPAVLNLKEDNLNITTSTDPSTGTNETVIYPTVVKTHIGGTAIIISNHNTVHIPIKSTSSMYISI